jgi:hypothetical protein
MTPHERLIEIVTHEVGVKESGGDNHGPRVEEYQKAVDNIAQGESWCFPGHMEILTADGWVRFDSISSFSGEVAQVNEAGEISFTAEWVPVAKQYTGPGFQVKTRSHSFCVDAGHRFWGRFNGSVEPTFGTLDRVTTSLQISSAKTTSRGCQLTDYEIRLLAAFLAEGCLSKTSGAGVRHTPRIRIQVSKEREIAACESLNPLSRYTAKKAYGKSKVPLTTFGYAVPESFAEIFTAYKEPSWSFISSFSSEQARLFLETYAQFDGSKLPDSSSIRLFTSSTILRDQLIALITLAGYIAYTTTQDSPLSDRQGYVITYSTDKLTKVLRSKHITKIDFVDTPLYCVSVPDQRIIVRDENFNPIITGNCMAFVQWAIKQVEAEFGIKSVLFKSEHCLTVWDKTPVSARLATPIPGAVMIWRHGNTTNGHTGIVTSVTENSVGTVEGNTSDGKGVNRNGDGVYARVRSRVGSGSMKVVGWINPFPTV